MSVDCILIFPYLEEANWKNELRSKDNLALGYLASCARQANYSVEIIHAEHKKMSTEEIIEIVKKIKPRTIGLSCTAQRAYPIVREYSNRIKKELEVPIFLGGIFPTIAYDKILYDCKNIDIICLGEGEKFIVDFLDCVFNKKDYKNILGSAYLDDSNNLLVNKKNNVIEDLDSLPFPAKDFFDDMQEEIKSGFYYINVSAGRGCYGNCSFCSTGKLTGIRKRRVRSPNNVVSEIKFFQQKYKVNYFKFIDELFIDKNNLKWIYDFCNEVEKQKLKIKFHIEARVDSISKQILRRLKKVGLDEVFIGLESGSQLVLDRYRKGHNIKTAEKAVKLIRKFRIKCQYGYIMIDPLLSFDQLKCNLKWLLNLGGYSKHNLYNKLNLYYGTDMYNDIKVFEEKKECTFYDREITYFKDLKVEKFSSLIEIAKKLFNEYNEKINKILLFMIKNHKFKKKWKKIASKVNSKEVNVWKKIVLEAIEMVENENNDEKLWNSFILNKIEKLKKTNDKTTFNNKLFIERGGIC